MIHSYNEGLLPEKLKFGPLGEIPYLSVNAFSKDQHSTQQGWNNSRAFFLTHYAEDIIRDVLNIGFLYNFSKSPDFSGIIFMHELCYNHLIYWITTASQPSDQLTNERIFRLLQHLRRKSKIVFLETNRRIRLIFGNKSEQRNHSIVDVTPISAGHNAGSIMLLIEPRPQGEGEGDENEERVLYTGNCRVTLQDLRDSLPLLHKCGALKAITRLYIDTTFCMPHVNELPTRGMVERQLLDFMKEEFTYSADIRFEIWTPFISSIQFLRSIYLEYHESIHVPLNLSILLEQLPGYKSWTTSSHASGPESHFHYSCRQVNNNSSCSDGNFNAMYDVCNISLQCDMFRTPVYPTEDETHWNEDSQAVYVKKPDIFRGIYSSHLSRYEIARMINFLGVNFENVYPIYRPKFMAVQHVTKLLAKTCEEIKDSKDEPEEYSSHTYDFTGENPTKKEFYRRKPIEYYFDTDNEIDLLGLQNIGIGVRYDLKRDKKVTFQSKKVSEIEESRQVVSACTLKSTESVDASESVDLECEKKKPLSA